MKSKVYVVDPNAAVQTIATLALQQLGVAVRVFPSTEKAAEAMHSEKPDLVICATEHVGEPNELLRAAKAVGSKFVLLITSTAGGSPPAGVDATLIKPFKSEQVKEIVQKILGPGPQLPTLILMRERVIARALEKFLEKHRVPTISIPSAEDAPVGQRFLLTITDLRSEEVLEWFDPTIMGGLMLVRQKSEKLPPMLAKLSPKVLTGALSLDQLTAPLSQVLGMDVESAVPRTRSLSPAEQARLAAEISAAVYVELLRDQALGGRRWDDAAQIAERETIRICEEYAKR